MSSHSHPAPDSSEWNNPDFCPFCGAELTDPGQGFIDHLDSTPTCKERFEDWRDEIKGDIEGEWST